MATEAKVDRRLERLSRMCAELPEVVEERRGSHASFSVRGKKFSYFLPSRSRHDRLGRGR
ncbi:MAG TPA: hypothetical protein VHI95_12480 [Acidimicrobiales bacterium]|nr:hypothetical protein [Acidimicrobiales bacterium]